MPFSFVHYRVANMSPELSRFFGVIISMDTRDHPPPHLHARYAEHEATFSIEDGSLLQGSLPPRVRGFVTEWAAFTRKS
jgi:hypothetical protein